MKCIAYNSGYKYQLKESYTLATEIKPINPIDTDYIKLDLSGDLTIKKGYAWDGPSGPAIDTANFMRGSLVHDALYQLMRERLLDHDEFRPQADLLLREMCRQDGMSAIRAWWVYCGVLCGGKPAANPANNKSIIIA